MIKIKKLFYMATFFLIVFLPLVVQVSSNLLQMPRVLIGLPLVLIFVCASLSLLLKPLSRKQSWLFGLLVVSFLLSLIKGYLHPNTNIIGVLAYTRSLWIFVLFFLFGYGCAKLNLLKDVKFILCLYFFVSFLLLIFEFLGGADAAIFLGYNNFKELSALRWEASHTKAFFNLSLFSSYPIYRPDGPTGSTISYAYSLLVFPFIFKVYSKAFYLSLVIIFFVLMMLGSKGALILFLILFMTFFYFRTFEGLRFAIVICIFLTVCISFVQIITNDNHGLGFLGGVFNLYEYPLGRGIGVGGNLAGEFFNSEDGSRSFMYGSESIFGVFFTQIGVMFFVQLLFLFSLMKSASVFTTASEKSLITICVLVVFFGITQEEAWSTLAALPFLFLGAQLYSKKTRFN